MEIVNTHTGKIYVDIPHNLEFLTVGDYGKAANLKADFLGLHKPIYGVQHKEVDLSQKWVATISTQKGCAMKCTFCDCPNFGFYGNCSEDDLEYQIRTILEGESTKQTSRFNVHFARMGEPTFNPQVIAFTEFRLRELVAEHINAETVHPVVSTMMPRSNKELPNFLYYWCEIKNNVYKGEAGLQLSINSTDDFQRSKQFNNQSLLLHDIADLASILPEPVGRKYTLNFAVTKDSIIDPRRLTLLFNPKHFLIKITPIHMTRNAVTNNYNITTEYDDYDVYSKFEEPLLNAGWDVIVFVPSKEEDEDRITCGNALIARAVTVKNFFK